MIDIYGGKDPRELPRYSTAEAAHYLRQPRATLDTWVHGRVDGNGHRAEPVIRLPHDSTLLSFQNLVEAHVLAFGKPVVAKTGVPVSVIVGRYRAGEDVSTIAKDYGVSLDQTHDAIRTAIPAAA